MLTSKGPLGPETSQTVQCADFWQMGYTTMIMDPGVRVAYQPHLARRLYTPDVDPLFLSTPYAHAVAYLLQLII